MKITKFKALMLLLFTTSIAVNAQTLKKVETFYDPYTKTKIHEAYTTLSTPPYLKHGIYKEWDQYGTLENEIQFSSGKRNGVSKIYYGTGAAQLSGRKDIIGKVAFVSNYINNELNGFDQKFEYPNGRQQMVLQKTWIKGKQTKQEEWYEDGKPKSISLENGLNVSWHPNGKKSSEVTMKDGVENGKVTEWYENGKMAFTATFINGKQVGEAVVYFEDGTARKRMNYDTNTFKDMHTIEYYPSGKVKWDRLATDNQHYKISSYDSLKGYKLLEQELIDDSRSTSGKLLPHGKCVELNEDGSVIEEKVFDNGLLNAKVQTLTSDRKVVLQGEYKQNKKIGEWLYYLKEDGSKTNKIEEAFNYRKIYYGPYGQKPYKYVDYYITGEKMAEGMLVGDFPDINISSYTSYYKNGQPYEKGQFKQGESTGVWEYFDESGKLIDTKSF